MILEYFGNFAVLIFFNDIRKYKKVPDIMLAKCSPISKNITQSSLSCSEHLNYKLISTWCKHLENNIEKIIITKTFATLENLNDYFNIPNNRMELFEGSEYIINGPYENSLCAYACLIILIEQRLYADLQLFIESDLNLFYNIKNIKPDELTLTFLESQVEKFDIINYPSKLYELLFRRKFDVINEKFLSGVEYVDLYLYLFPYIIHDQVENFLSNHETEKYTKVFFHQNLNESIVEFIQNNHIEPNVMINIDFLKVIRSAEKYFERRLKDKTEHNAACLWFKVESKILKDAEFRIGLDNLYKENNNNLLLKALIDAIATYKGDEVLLKMKTTYENVLIFNSTESTKKIYRSCKYKPLNLKLVRDFYIYIGIDHIIRSSEVNILRYTCFISIINLHWKEERHVFTNKFMELLIKTCTELINICPGISTNITRKIILEIENMNFRDFEGFLIADMTYNLFDNYYELVCRQLNYVLIESKLKCIEMTNYDLSKFIEDVVPDFYIKIEKNYIIYQLILMVFSKLKMDEPIQSVLYRYLKKKKIRTLGIDALNKDSFGQSISEDTYMQYNRE